MKKIINFLKNQKGDYVQMIYLFPIYMMVFSFLAIKLDLITTRSALDDDLRISLRTSIRGDNDEDFLNGLKRGLHKDEWSRKDDNVIYTFSVNRVDLKNKHEEKIGGGNNETKTGELFDQSIWNQIKNPADGIIYIVDVYARRESRINTGWTSITIGGVKMQWFDQHVSVRGRMVIERGRT